MKANKNQCNYSQRFQCFSSYSLLVKGSYCTANSMIFSVSCCNEGSQDGYTFDIDIAMIINDCKLNKKCKCNLLCKNSYIFPGLSQLPCTHWIDSPKPKLHYILLLVTLFLLHSAIEKHPINMATYQWVRDSRSLESSG